MPLRQLHAAVFEPSFLRFFHSGCRYATLIRHYGDAFFHITLFALRYDAITLLSPLAYAISCHDAFADVFFFFRRCRYATHVACYGLIFQKDYAAAIRLRVAALLRR